MHWQCRDRRLICDKIPLIMGILNVTPDSFSDGGRFTDTTAAISTAKQMLKDGADIIDIGGESTRPGAAKVDAQEELQRIAPVIEALAAETNAVISVDTSKAAVARETLKMGAHIINDVSALSGDAAMAEVVAEFRAGVVLMHMQGSPQTMQNNPCYHNITDEIYRYLETQIELAVSSGIPRENIAVDPGIGFGKTTEHNLMLLAKLSNLKKLGQPLLIGLSRKRFIGTLTGMPVEQRESGSLAGLACSVLNGANIMRVHDVRSSWQAARIAAAIRDPHNIDALQESTTC
jgi:dihydropteroate synthase